MIKLVMKDFLIYLSVFIGVFAVSYYFLSLKALGGKEKKRDFKDSELPTVSVVIPAYNEEETIKKTIESALNLDYPKEKIEIIIVDDGSKDKTYSIAKKIKNNRVSVLTKSNGGKAKALNLGISKAKGEIIVTMDADSYAEPDSLRKMINYFTNPKVMCVTPSMAIHDPKGFWQRLQQAEYLVGVFLRKSFSTMNAIHVTPGAFSAYKKIFFQKHGGFDESGNLTEDMEMALRIQSKGYSLSCSDDSVVFTKAPKTFADLLRQRKRWYYGWIQNLINYRRLFSRKYGHMGVIVLPMAVISIVMSVILTLFIVFSTLSDLRRELLYLQSVHFSFPGIFNINLFAFERFFYYFFSNPASIIFIVFLGIVIGYLVFAKKRVKKYTDVYFGMTLFIFTYSILLTFWWLLSAFYYFFIGKTSWGKQ